MRIVAHSHTEKPRLKWVAAAIAIPLFGMVAAFGTVKDSPDPLFTQTIIESLAVTGAAPSAGDETVYFHEDKLQRGDTLAVLLDRMGVDDGDSQMRAASSVRSSKTSSGTVSRTSYCQSTLRRLASFGWD